ncbi:MAG: cysteine-rich CWC family protein [Ignavibacteriaceae bacterium]
MASHEIKYCSICSIAFECKVGNITQCQCFEVQLSEEEKEFIYNQYQDCLCKNCLIELKKEYSRQKIKRKEST